MGGGKMKPEQIVTIGGLLHDVGKVLFRTSRVDGRNHSLSGWEFISRYTDEKRILDCIRYHHKDSISDADLEEDSLAYIVYIADNIASGADRREAEDSGKYGFDKTQPLQSIYNLLNNRSNNLVHSVDRIRDRINYPRKPEDNADDGYSGILSGFSDGLRGLSFEPEYVHSLLELCEAYFSYVPSSTQTAEVADISLFDHSKITAGCAACISLYLQSANRTNYYKELFKNEQEFLDEKAFLIVSLDISGIQQFIYSIASKGALKNLRARSFYLEILLENSADEILSAVGLTRANLLYTGGGHAYLLLPNTSDAKRAVTVTLKNINRRLVERFGVLLFIAYGMEACSANELMSKTGDPESYENIFRSASSQIAAMKLRRYSADDLRWLNSRGTGNAERECTICGVTDSLDDARNICTMCASLIDMSGRLLESDRLFVVLQEKMDDVCLPMFSGDGSTAYLHAMSEADARRILEENREKVIRLYSKNAFRTGLALATKLWMGDYHAETEEGELKTFEELAKSSEGIERIAVLRADVDNLGAAFVKGFVRAFEKENKKRYVTISRTSTLSRSLSLFFKYHVNTVLRNPSYFLSKVKDTRNVVVVYSGGDDMFIVGAWDDVLCAAVDLYEAFQKYTGGALTLSAGYAVFDYKYPISRMAMESGKLEERAKANQYGNESKNSISLFGLELEDGYLVDHHTYNWRVFLDKVVGEKYRAVQNLFVRVPGYGSSFLYNILNFLRQSRYDKINVARLAFLLARQESKQNASREEKEAYSEFSQSLYKWALNEEDRRQLITAIMLYVYSMREKEEMDNGR